MSLAEVLDRMIREGDALLKAGRYAEGEARAREVLARQPRSSGGHYLLGYSALLQQRHAEALAHFEAALRTDRVNPQLHFMAALCHAAGGRGEDAITAYRRALQYRPDFIEAQANMAYLLEHAGRAQEAADAYRRALALDPNEWFCLNRLGYCERVLGHADAAIEVLRRALALRPDSAPTHNELALALLQANRQAEALASLRAAVAADPGLAEAWANLAKLLYVEHLEKLQRGEAADAGAVVECFDRLMAFDPSNAEFRYLRDSLAGAQVDRPPDGYVATFFDRFAPRFEERLLGELRYAGPAEAEKALQPYLHGRTGLHVVDLGCGTGLSAAGLRACAARLVGVDLSSAMLERARVRGVYDELAQAEIGDYLAALPAGSVDLAVALDVFIYVGALERIFAAVAAALAPGGLFAFTVEAAASGRFTLSPAGRYSHAREYVDQALSEAGLAQREAHDFIIREEAGRPVPARIFVAEKPRA